MKRLYCLLCVFYFTFPSLSVLFLRFIHVCCAGFRLFVETELPWTFSTRLSALHIHRFLGDIPRSETAGKDGSGISSSQCKPKHGPLDTLLRISRQQVPGVGTCDHRYNARRLPASSPSRRSHVKGLCLGDGSAESVCCSPSSATFAAIRLFNFCQCNECKIPSPWDCTWHFLGHPRKQVT